MPCTPGWARPRLGSRSYVLQHSPPASAIHVFCVSIPLTRVEIICYSLRAHSYWGSLLRSRRWEPVRAPRNLPRSYPVAFSVSDRVWGKGSGTSRPPAVTYPSPPALFLCGTMGGPSQPGRQLEAGHPPDPAGGCQLAGFLRRSNNITKDNTNNNTNNNNRNDDNNNINVAAW